MKIREVIRKKILKKKKSRNRRTRKQSPSDHRLQVRILKRRDGRVGIVAAKLAGQQDLRFNRRRTGENKRKGKDRGDADDGKRSDQVRTREPHGRVLESAGGV